MIENVAETELKADTALDNEHNTRALCVGVIAARCTGMFRKDASSDYFHPDRENQFTLLESLAVKGNDLESKNSNQPIPNGPFD